MQMKDQIRNELLTIIALSMVSRSPRSLHANQIITISFQSFGKCTASERALRLKHLCASDLASAQIFDLVLASVGITTLFYACGFWSNRHQRIDYLIGCKVLFSHVYR